MAQDSTPNSDQPAEGGLSSCFYPAIVPVRKIGDEPFHTSQVTLGFDLKSFWQWVASDLANNTLRGLVAEYLVAQALGIADGVRIEWEPYDLRSPRGTTVEVKTSAYLQSWAQTRLSTISFDVAPTRAWSATSNRFDEAVKRQAEVYVFALLKHRDKNTLDPLDVGQWSFFIMATNALDAATTVQKSISLNRLLSLKPIEANFSTLRESIDAAAPKA